MAVSGGEIAVTTLALASLLREAVVTVPGPVVVLGPPREVPPGAPPSVGVYVFHVAATAPPAAQPRPLRPGPVVGARTPQWELDYLIYCGGDSARCEPEIMLALVIDALAATPIVDPAAGTAAFQAMHPDRPPPAELGTIRVAPLALAPTERAALWSMLSVPYQLSVEYRAAVVVT